MIVIGIEIEVVVVVAAAAWVALGSDGGKKTMKRRLETAGAAGLIGSLAGLIASSLAAAAAAAAVVVVVLVDSAVAMAYCLFGSFQARIHRGYWTLSTINDMKLYVSKFAIRDHNRIIICVITQIIMWVCTLYIYTLRCVTSRELEVGDTYSSSVVRSD